jgi:hypothetical protein
MVDILVRRDFDTIDIFVDVDLFLTVVELFDVASVTALGKLSNSQNDGLRPML